VHDDPAGQVGPSEAGAQLRGVRRIRPVVAGEMERGDVGREAGEAIEQAVDALAPDPIGDAQEYRQAPLPEIAGRGTGAAGDVAARGHHAQAGPRHAPCLQVVCQRLARNEQGAGMTIGEPIQPGLDGGAERAMIDSARWLMEHPDERDRRRPDGDPGAEEGGGDAVQDEHVGAERAAPSEHRRGRQRGEREGAVRERDERDPTAMPWGQAGQALMVQVAAGQATRVPES
jgi:hypothetical protein